MNDQIQNGDQFFTVCSEGGGGGCVLLMCSLAGVVWVSVVVHFC